MANATTVYNDNIVHPYDKEFDAIVYGKRDMYPLLDRLSMNSEMKKAKYVTWVQREPLRQFYLVTDLAATSSTGTTSLTFTGGSSAGLGATTGQPIYSMQLGDLIKINDEVMRVSAATTVTNASSSTNGYTSVTVERGACSTTAAVHTAYTEAKWVGNAVPVDQAHPGAWNDPGTTFTQYMQRFWAATEVDVASDEITQDVSFVSAERRDNILRPMEIMHKMEAQIIDGAAATPTNSTKWGAWAGLKAHSTEMSTTVTAGAMTQTQFENCLVEMENRGINVDLVICGLYGRQGVNKWYHGEIDTKPVNGSNLPRVQTWLPLLTATKSQIEVMPHPLLAAGDILFVDSSMIKLYWLYKLYWRTMGDDGGGPRRLFEAMNVLKCGASLKLGKLTSLTGTPA